MYFMAIKYYLTGNGWMDSFQEYYIKQYIFSTMSEVAEHKRQTFSQMSEWVSHRDRILRQMMNERPTSEMSVAVIDLINLKSQTDPTVSFDVLVSVKKFLNKIQNMICHCHY